MEQPALNLPSEVGKQRESNFKFAFQTPGSSVVQAKTREDAGPNLAATRTSCHRLPIPMGQSETLTTVDGHNLCSTLVPDIGPK